MKLFYPTFFSLTFSFLIQCQGADPVVGQSTVTAPLSLDDVTRTVIAENPSIKSALKKWSAMKSRVPQAAAWDDLRINSSDKLYRFVSVQPNAFTDQTLSVAQVIPLSGKNRSRARAAVADALTTFEEVRRQELDVVANARASYFRLADIYAQIELNRKNLISLKQIAEISRSKYETGGESAAYVLVAETEYSKLLETGRDLDQQLSAEQTELNVLMNRDAFAPIGVPVEIIGETPVPPVETLRGLTLAQRPEVRMAAARVEEKKALLQLAHREWIPDPAITVEAQRYNGASQGASEVDAGISFNVPWVNYGKYSAEIHEAEDNLDAAQLDLQRSQNEAIGMLRDALTKVETQHHHLELFRGKLVPQARQAFEASQLAYQNGKDFLRGLDRRAAQPARPRIDGPAAFERIPGRHRGTRSSRRNQSRNPFTHQNYKTMKYQRRTFLRLVAYSSGALMLGACGKKQAATPPDVDYYTCTMHPSVHSAVPGKCPICSMDLVPVMKKGMADTGGNQTNEFAVPVERQQQIGVTYAMVERKPLHASTRAVGMVTVDLTRHWAFVSRVDGYVQETFVTSPGEIVEKNQPLMSIYSPDLLTTEREFVMLLKMRDEAGHGTAPDDLIASAKIRLKQWNVTDEQIAELEKTRQPSETLTLRSPFRGVIEEVPVHQGVNVKTGDHLVDVADLSDVWVWAEFYESELSMLQQGQKVVVTVNSFPDEKFEGTIALINPFIDEMKRTSKVRIDIANPDFKLRPGMYANVELGRDMGDGLVIPVDAVMPTGSRDIVFVDKGEGKLEPRVVKLGGKYGEFYEVKHGVKEGERVVASAIFLIDAESKVQGALKDFDASSSPAPEEKP